MCHPGIEREMIIDEDTSQVIPTLSTVRKAHRLMDPVQLDPSTLTPLSKSKKAKTFSKKDRWVLKYSFLQYYKLVTMAQGVILLL